MIPSICVILLFYIYRNINPFQVVLFDLIIFVFVQIIIVFPLRAFVESMLNDDHDRVIKIEYVIVIH